MKVFISGGCKNGKSYYAQRIAKWLSGGGALYYVATMNPTDSEDDERIARHKSERDGWGFVTVEQPRDIEAILDKCDRGGAFLLDSLTALLANEMFPADGRINGRAGEKIASGLVKVIGRVKRIVIVSDYIYSDALPYDPFTEMYRQSLAALDRLAASHCNLVLESAYTGITVHKGEDVFSALS